MTPRRQTTRPANPGRRRTDQVHPGIEDVVLVLEIARSMTERLDRPRLHRLTNARRRDLLSWGRTTLIRLQHLLAELAPPEDRT